MFASTKLSSAQRLIFAVTAAAIVIASLAFAWKVQSTMHHGTVTVEQLQ